MMTRDIFSRIYIYIYIYTWLTLQLMEVCLVTTYIFHPQSINTALECIVATTCYYSLSENAYNHVVKCRWCKAELLRKWPWINAINVSRTSSPMPGKSHVLPVTKYFMWNISHCLHLTWQFWKITELRGIILSTYKPYFRSIILNFLAEIEQSSPKKSSMYLSDKLTMPFSWMIKILFLILSETDPDLHYFKYFNHLGYNCNYFCRVNLA